MSESKTEIQGALWRIPPVDDTEPPLDSPGISPGSGHSRSLQLICHFDNKHENIRRLVYITHSIPECPVAHTCIKLCCALNHAVN